MPLADRSEEATLAGRLGLSLITPRWQMSLLTVVYFAPRTLAGMYRRSGRVSHAIIAAMTTPRGPLIRTTLHLNKASTFPPGGVVHHFTSLSP